MSQPAPDPHVLDDIVIQKPCPISWGAIDGAGPVRSCQVCQKSVFDLIEITSVAASQILAESKDLPCVRICRTPDGRIVTADSPVGFRMRIWRGLRRRSGWAASLFVLIFLPGCQTLMNSCFQYGAPARTIKSTQPGKVLSGDSTPSSVDATSTPASGG